MAKSDSFVFASLFLLALSSCQSLEQISIDYMQPGDLSFPPQLRRVAIVNNTSTVPDNKLILDTHKPKESTPEVSRAVAYSNGDPKITTESLAEEIARQNYFEEVVICDSALRANDGMLRETTLSQKEVEKLTSDLGVDFIIALENLQFKASRTIHYLPEFGCYRGTVDAKVYPTIKVYLPGRSKPMTTLHPNDSIFWEEFGGSVAEATTRIISDTQALKEAAEFAGTIPVKQLLPYWTQKSRYLYTGGSVQMRDATIYVRENSWDKAYALWLQALESSKSEKKKMKAALNIALYFEMTDSLTKAEEWAVKAQQFAKKVDGMDKQSTETKVDLNQIPNYYLTTLYVNELKERNSQMPRLKMQMSRFNDDF